MAHDRLSAQDATFLHLERVTAPMHVGSLAIFEGEPFSDADGKFRIDDARDTIEARLHLVPRFRRRLMTVPFQQGRPIWVDDDHFDVTYHVRLTALPKPGSEQQLKALMGRLQSQVLDRRRPLWELWFVEGLEGGRVAIIQKTHHALVDGISGIDVATVLLDPGRDSPSPSPLEWAPETAPNAARLLLDSVVERATQPAELVRSARAVVPRTAPGRLPALEAGRTASLLGRTAPRLPFNVAVGPHRRFEVVRASLAEAKAAKRVLGGTVNDVVLAAVTGGLRHYLLMRGETVEDVQVRVMVPVSVRDESERLKLGNRVAAVFAELPVGEPDPAARLQAISAQMTELKESGRAMGAEAITAMADFAPPNLLALAARLVPRQRAVNLAVTNVPGPQFPLYCMGARMLDAFPYVGVVDNMALMIGVVSYDGQLGFGITGDREAIPDLEVVAEGIEKSFAELSAAIA